MFSFRKTPPEPIATSRDRRATEAGASPNAIPVELQTKPTLAEEMTKYGITRVPVDYFHFGKHRYTSLKDALAQAKKGTRGRAPGPASAMPPGGRPDLQE